jgi:hypothetical protein
VIEAGSKTETKLVVQTCIVSTDTNHPPTAAQAGRPVPTFMKLEIESNSSLRVLE